MRLNFGHALDPSVLHKVRLQWLMFDRKNEQAMVYGIDNVLRDREIGGGVEHGHDNCTLATSFV